MFFIFPNRSGCLWSLLISALGTFVLPVLTGWPRL